MCSGSPLGSPHSQPWHILHRKVSKRHLNQKLESTQLDYCQEGAVVLFWGLSTWPLKEAHSRSLYSLSDSIWSIIIGQHQSHFAFHLTFSLESNDSLRIHSPWEMKAWNVDVVFKTSKTIVMDRFPFDSLKIPWARGWTLWCFWQSFDFPEGLYSSQNIHFTKYLYKTYLDDFS